MIYPTGSPMIHFTGTAECPTLKLKRHNTVTDTPLPSFILLFTCLKRMTSLVNYPRLRFILSRGSNEPDARLDFYYFQEDDIVHLHYREVNHDNIYLGPINSDGHFAIKPFPKQSAIHITNLLFELVTDFPTAVESYGQRTHLCALCGLPLIDPSSLTRGTTPNCTIHLQPPADLGDIT